MTDTACENRLIVPREQWRSTRVYGYCPACDDVFGVPKTEVLRCPTCEITCQDIFAEIVDRVSTVWDFFETMRVQEGPFGRFREGDNSNPYELKATYHAIEKWQLLVEYGFEHPYTPEQIDEWVETILLDLNPETGLIEDPFLAKDTGRSEEFMAVTDNHSNRFQEVFTKMGKPEAYQVPLRQLQGHDHLTSRESALAFLNDETWEHQPWGKGSGTMKQVIRHDEILRQNGEPDDGMAEFVHNWLDEHQDPATGYWFGERASPNNRACGAYKLICWLYRPRQWKINYLDKIVDTTLALQSPRGDFGGGAYSCEVWDPVLLLKMGLDRRPDYRGEEIFAAAARVFLNIKDRWNESDHTFTFDTSKPSKVIDLMHMSIIPFNAEILLGVPTFEDG